MPFGFRNLNWKNISPFHEWSDPWFGLLFRLCWRYPGVLTSLRGDERHFRILFGLDYFFNMKLSTLGNVLWGLQVKLSTEHGHHSPPAIPITQNRSRFTSLSRNGKIFTGSSFPMQQNFKDLFMPFSAAPRPQQITTRTLVTTVGTRIPCKQGQPRYCHYSRSSTPRWTISSWPLWLWTTLLDCLLMPPASQ